jgi:hypothetical protein
MNTTRQFRLFSGVLILSAVLLYARVLGYNYLWDDVHIFRGVISSLLEDSFSLSGVAQPFLENIRYFRPLTVFSFWLDATIAGNRPGVSHAVNLFLFLLNIGLVFAICRRLAETVGQKHALWRAFCAALIYAVHPAMVESTVWISGRFDVLATTFILSATWVYLDQRPALWRVGTFAVLAFCSMLSKETGIMLGATVPCLYLALEVSRHESPLTYTHFRQSFSQNDRMLNAFLLALVLYAVLRLVFDPVTHSSLSSSWDALLILESLKFYLLQSLFPFASMGPQHPIEFILSPWSAIDILGNFATIISMAALFFYALRRQSTAAWVFIAGTCYLLLVLHILPLDGDNGIGHERYLTTPLAFWAMAAALVRWERVFATPFMQKLAAAMNVLSPAKIFAAAATLWLLMFTWTTHTTIPIWQNDLILWTWGHQQFPEDRYSRYNYFRAMLASSPKAAEKATQQLIEESGFLYADEYVALASILLREDDKKGLDYLALVRQQAEHTFDIHKKQNAEILRAKLSALESSLIATYYSLSSHAYFQFSKNPMTALQLNETARWYREVKNWNEKQEHAYELRKAIYQYGLGLNRPAEALRSKLTAIYGKNAVDKILYTALNSYCDLKPEEKDLAAQLPPMPICAQLDNFFPEFSNQQQNNSENNTPAGSI